MAASRTKKILLVEDEAIVAMAEAHIIRSFGYELVSAFRGEQAVALATRDEQIDLILMDIDLGHGIDGTQAARLILQQRNLPIVFLTSHSEREMVEKVRDITRYGYVIKNSGDFVLQSSIEMAFELFEAHERTRHLNRVYAVLSNINQAIVRIRDPQEMLKEACRIAVEDGGFALAWIGLFDAHTNMLHSTVHTAKTATLQHQPGNFTSLSDALTNALREHSLAWLHERFVCNDIQSDPRLDGRFVAILPSGLRSFVTLPLTIAGSVRGVIHLYATIPEFFEQAEMQLLNELAMDLGYALEFFEKEAERKHAQQALLVAEQRFRQMAENIQEVFWMFDFEQQGITYINPAYEKIWGRTCQSAYENGYSFLENVHPADQETVRLAHERQQSGQQTDVEYRVVQPDGTVRWVWDRAFPILDQAGKIVRVAGVVSDIHERKQAEQIIGELSRQNAEAIRLARLAYWDFDVASRMFTLNDQFFALHGINAEEVGGYQIGLDTFFQHFIHPDYIPQMLAIFQEAIQASDPDYETQAEGQVRHRNGEYFWINTWLHADKDTSGRTVRLHGVNQDITERKHAEQELHRNEQLLRLFVEYSPAAIAMFDREMRYIVASRRFLADYELGEQDLTGRSHYEVFPEINEDLKEIHRRCLAGAVEKGDEAPFLRNSGKMDWVHWEIHPWYETAGEIGGIILFSEVITERKQAEEKLRNSEAFLNRMIEQSPYAMWISDDKGTLIRINQACCTLLMITEDELMGKYNIFQDNMVEEQGLLPLVQAVYERGETAHFEITWTSARLRGFNLQKTEPVILDVTIFPIKDTQGRLTNAVIQHVDITKRRQAEEALRANEYKFRRFVEESIDGLLLIDEQGKVIEWNRNLELLTGLRREEMLGQYMWDVQFQLALEERRTPAVYENLKVQIKNALRTGATPLFEKPVDVTIRCADGTLRPVHQSIYPIKTDRGFWIGATVREATKSKPVESALRQGLDDMSAADDPVENYPSE